MFKSGKVLILVGLFVALPQMNAAAGPTLNSAAFSTAVYSPYARFDDVHYQRGHVRPYTRYLRRPSPWSYSPYQHHRRYYRPRPQHRRYFGLHGHRAPAWRAPGTLRYHRRYR